MEEEHVHRFPRSGNGCYCGAKRCQHTWIEAKPGYRPVKKYCNQAALGNSGRCQQHPRSS